MIKKALVTIVTMVMVMGFTACGDSSSSDSKQEPVSGTATSATSTEVPVEEPAAEPTEAPAEEVAADDGIISMETDDFGVVYSRHETGTDYEGKPCLYYYFTFTNKSDKNQIAAVVTSITAFQNGVECGIAISTDGRPETENYMKEVQPGGSLEVCEVYELADTSDVTIEAKDFMSFSDEKDVQILALQ